VYDDHRGALTGVEIVNEAGVSAKVFYVTPTEGIDLTSVRAGDIIGVTQDLGTVYPRGMTNHNHVEIRVNGVLKDPTKYLLNGS